METAIKLIGKRSFGSVVRLGFTLLEVLLALLLSGVVIALLVTATRTYLRAADRTSLDVEYAILGRNILQLIARDLQSLHLPAAQDVSGVSTAPLPGDGDDESGNAGSGNEGGPGGGSRRDGESISKNDGENGQAAPTPANNVVEATNATSLAVSGIYGDRYSLAIDVLAMEETGGVAIPQRVIWSVGTAPVATTNNALAAAASVAGLARRTAPRTVATWAEQNGSALGDGDLREISTRVAALEFRYFDGSQWLGEWDSAAQGGVPRAVEVAVLLAPPAGVLGEPNVRDFASDLFGLVSTEGTAASGAQRRVYRRLVALRSSANEVGTASAAPAVSDSQDSPAGTDSEGESR